jgi:EAL domain-containing protein (putative c-di-GMP-specific phosphodiesterase class I)
MSGSPQSPRSSTEYGALMRFLDRFLAQVPSGHVAALFLIQVDQQNRIGTSFDRTYVRRFCQQYAAKLRNFLPKGTVVVQLPERRFAVMLIRSSVLEAVDVGRSVIDRVEPRMQIGSEKFSVDVRIGVALSPTHADDGESLARRAELALKQAKDAGSTFEVYEPDASQYQRVLWRFETDLKQAIRDGQLEVHFQPKYSIQLGRITGAEALVRWRDQEGRMMPAAEFVPAAERAGVIVPMTWAVFDEVARCAPRLAQIDKPFTVAVNVPAQSLGDRSFFDRLKALKLEFERNEIGLIIELTEDGLLQTDAASLEALHRIRSLGVGLAIDDFGKGYSSLNYLRQIPATELKIDRDFIERILDSDKDRHIVRTAIELARAFGMQSVAEGVDSEPCLRELAALGCVAAQGFLIARPKDADALRSWRQADVLSALHRALQPSPPGSALSA